MNNSALTKIKLLLSSSIPFLATVSPKCELSNVHKRKLDEGLVHIKANTMSAIRTSIEWLWLVQWTNDHEILKNRRLISQTYMIN